MQNSPVQSWLEAASLPSGVSRRLSDDGFWSAGFAGLTLTIAADPSGTAMHVWVPLFTLEGSEPAGFWRHLLSLQLNGALPEGLMFAHEDEDGILALYGRYSTERLDAAAFDALLADVMRCAPALVESLRARIRSKSDEGLGQDVQQMTKPMSGVPAASAPQDASDVSNLSDDELFLRQMMQSMRI